MNNQSVITAYETCDLSVEEIAEEFQLDPLAVRMTLRGYSQLYRMREKEGKETKPDVDDEEYQQILTSYKQIALYSDNDAIREKACRRLMDEKKGRLDRNGGGGLKVNVGKINMIIQQTREARTKAIQGPAPQTEEKVVVEV